MELKAAKERGKVSIRAIYEFQIHVSSRLGVFAKTGSRSK